MKTSENLKNVLRTDFPVRIYRNGEMVVMFEGNDRSEQSNFAVLDENGPFHIYSSLEDKTIKTDNCGHEYVEYLYSELEGRFSEEEIESVIEFYESFNN